ncbi:LysR family transcriptional regulator [Klebsiella variicola]|nr:LysR family transcriptional regulator [Klebsiella variicola]
MVSFNVRQLENELGVTLLLRSTRRLRLTDAGTLFYQRGVALLKAAEKSAGMRCGPAIPA